MSWSAACTLSSALWRQDGPWSIAVLFTEGVMPLPLRLEEPLLSRKTEKQLSVVWPLANRLDSALRVSDTTVLARGAQYRAFL